MRKILVLLALPLAVAACADEPTSPALDPMEGATAFMTVDVDETTSEILYASKDVPVGEVIVKHLGAGQVEVTYAMDSGYCLAETHWDVVYSPDELTNNGGNPKIGQFRYGDDNLDCAPVYTETGTLEGSGDEYYVAAHAVVLGYEVIGDPAVVYGLRDVAGDGGEEGDIYGIDPYTGDLFLVADIANDTYGDEYSPNGLAIDRVDEMLYYVTRTGSGTSELYAIAADGSGSPSPVRSDLSGMIYNATIDGDYYYYVPNATDELWRVPLDGSAAPASYCDLGIGAELYFGDIAAVPENGTLFGVANRGDTGETIFFEVDLAACPTSASTWMVPTSYQFLLQVAFGDDGTLYGQQAVSADAEDPGRWYILGTEGTGYGEIVSELEQSEFSFTDIAGGLPLDVEFNFEETGWADGERFTQRGSWATYMGPFSISSAD